MKDLLSTSIRNGSRNAFDSLIVTFGKTSRLILPPKITYCDNCKIDPIGKKSSNIWINGGPAPFPNGSLCPMCEGKGTIAQEVYYDVTMLIQEDPTKFEKIFSVNFPDGAIQTKCFITELPKIQQCQYMIKHLDLINVLPQKYKLFGEPLCPGNIVQSRYIVALWERVI